MNIALIGYGKMGKAIENIALTQGHRVVLKIDLDNAVMLTTEHLQQADVAIEFTGPQSAVSNIMACIDAGIPVVSGSTGWMERWNQVADHCGKLNGTLLYASNFSIGVNIFFAVNKYLASLMNEQAAYTPSIHEVHHTQKKDAPSGTAISLAEQIITQQKRYISWVHEQPASANDMLITSERTDPAPGTHTVTWQSDIDTIQITHEAHSRIGFAAGAVLAATYLQNKKGIFTMQDVLGF